MCGRYALDAPRSQLCRRFSLDQCVELAPRYNIAPGSEIPVIRQSPAGLRVLHLLRWGLLPQWAKDQSLGTTLINARGESLAAKPAFRDAFRRRRCLIPASGFYEWRAAATQGVTRKQPCYISLKSAETMALGGLWEAWTSPAGDVVRSCCIVTIGANQLLRPIHQRMPLILPPEHWQAWLAAAADQVGMLIQPLPGSELQVWPVSHRVGKATENDPALIEACTGQPQ